MTMQISREQTIAGFPAYAVRNLMRYIRLHDAVTGGFVAHILKIEEPDGDILAAKLRKLGFLKKLKDSELPSVAGKGTKTPWYEITDLGISLALASGASRIKRRTADKIIEQLLDRVNQVNLDDRFLYSVTAVVAFGSYLSDSPDLGDIDLAIQLTPREPDPEAFLKMCTAKITSAYKEGRRFKNLTDEVCWPRNEVRLYLRNRKRSLSMPYLDELPALAKRKSFRYRILVGDNNAVRKLIGPTAIKV